MEENRICPETHLTKAILVTLFCCLPFGIVSILNANKVASAFAVGDYDEAVRKSEEANKWANISIILGIVWAVLTFVFTLLAEL